MELTAEQKQSFGRQIGLLRKIVSYCGVKIKEISWEGEGEISLDFDNDVSVYISFKDGAEVGQYITTGGSYMEPPDCDFVNAFPNDVLRWSDAFGVARKVLLIPRMNEIECMFENYHWTGGGRLPLEEEL